jgi:16S rRNA processing protein RimM
LDGGLLVALHSDDAANLHGASQLVLSGTPGDVPFGVRRIEVNGRSARIWLDGMIDRTSAERWAGAAVCIPEAALPALPDGEFYWREIIGTRCRLPDGQTLGTVREIWPTGSNDVLVVEGASGTVLVPATEEVLVRLDRAAGELWIDPPAGLLDAEPEADA